MFMSFIHLNEVIVNSKVFLFKIIYSRNSRSNESNNKENEVKRNVDFEPTVTVPVEYDSENLRNRKYFNSQWYTLIANFIYRYLYTQYCIIFKFNVAIQLFDLVIINCNFWQIHFFRYLILAIWLVKRQVLNQNLYTYKIYGIY